MMLAVRRSLAGCGAALALMLGTGITQAQAETPVASPTSSASSTSSVTAAASATGTSSSSDEMSNEIAAQDNSSQYIALGAAGVLAVIAALVVLLRRR